MENFKISLNNYKKNAISKLILIRDQITLNSKEEIKNSILLSGDARSGTTWIPNIINYKMEYRYLFEPFHPLHIKICKKFENYQYLRVSDNRDYFLNVANRILSGKIRHPRIDRFNDKYIYPKRIIKDIFTNLLLRWIKEHFPDLKIVLLMRHPCAVAYSKLVLRHWSWPDNPEEFFNQQDLIDDFLFPFVEDIRESKTKSYFEKQVLIWCILNYVPLKQFKENQIHISFYENFCINPELEIKRLFSFLKLNLEIDEKIYRILDKPSKSSKSLKHKTSKQDLISKWRNNISPKELSSSIKIIEKFGLDSIYTDNLMPNVDGAYNMLKRK